MPRHRPIVLLTGFGPFPGQPQNASSLLANALAGAARRRIPGYCFEAATLPTEWHAGPARLAELLLLHRPVLCVHFGVSRRASGFVVETRARNSRQDVPDACGAHPHEACVTPSGPEELRVTLPTGEIAQRLRRMSLPVQLSRDAGGYLCNAILYHSLRDGFAGGIVDGGGGGGGGLGPRRGFIHIPDRLAGSAEGMGIGSAGSRRPAPASHLAWDEAVAGGLEILAVSTAVRG